MKASGEADIDGIATTRYTGTIDLQKVLEGFAEVVGGDADPETTEQLEAAVEQFEALGIDGEILFQIWIDEEGLPRRQRITMALGDLVPGTGDAQLEMTVEYSAFGEPVDVEPRRRRRSPTSRGCWAMRGRPVRSQAHTARSARRSWITRCPFPSGVASPVRSIR